LTPFFDFAGFLKGDVVIAYNGAYPDFEYFVVFDRGYYGH